MSEPLPPPTSRTPDGAPDPGRARVGRLLLWQSAALLGMIGAFSLPLPWKLLTLALALTAVVLGVRTWTVSRRAGRSGAGSAGSRGSGAGATGAGRAAAAAGIALGLLGLTIGALPLLAWNQTVQLEQCTASALTVRAQQECAAEFTRQVEELTGLPQAG
ncbi:hypothetical protein NJC10_05805 [Micrococcus sp. M4NT]|uniref:hypothetical protein n=1 Tax=Micrococcus sp. M4NT TaxID=2957501 RepID=UPI0029AC2CC5|nr:hypothetical protein [Micrococcus sp. M4NT]MDX2341181.1 hypothetical protein [Micrococcus sp. M4NT]